MQRTMHKIIRGVRSRAHDVLLYGVIAAYLVILAVFLFGKSGAARSVNLVPFRFVADYITGHGVLAFSNVAGNVLLFFPLGVYLELLFGERLGVWRTEGIVLAVSAAVELLQFVTATGVTDVDDLLLNGLGGLAGILCLRLLRRRLGAKTRPAVEYISLGVGVFFVVLMLCLRFGVFGIRIKIL